MDALTLINKHVDAVKLMEHYAFSRMNPEGNVIRSCCKIHDGDNPTSFVMNPETGLWYCHTGCGGGDIYTMVQKIENCDFMRAVHFVAEFFGVDIENMQITERKESFQKEMQSWMRTMQSRKRKVASAYTIDVPVRSVRKFRDFDASTLEHFGLGFVDEISLDKKSGEKYTLRNRLLIPIVQGGIQVGASFRKTKAQDYPKWSHQPLSIATGELLYNYDEAENQRSIVVCEGAFDVWAFHEIDVTAVATYGAHITDEQYKLLMRTGADLVFAYDGDEAGRNTMEKAKELFQYKANIEFVVFDEDEDPASIPRNQLKLKYESRMKNYAIKTKRNTNDSNR